jgi:hypothetical protein
LYILRGASRKGNLSRSASTEWNFVVRGGYGRTVDGETIPISSKLAELCVSIGGAQRSTELLPALRVRARPPGWSCVVSTSNCHGDHACPSANGSEKHAPVPHTASDPCPIHWRRRSTSDAYKLFCTACHRVVQLWVPSAARPSGGIPTSRIGGRGDVTPAPRACRAKSLQVGARPPNSSRWPR